MVDTRGMTFFLDRARNLAGRPITRENRDKLAAVIKNPCLATWEAAYGVILNEQQWTLWMAVVAVQPMPRTTVAGDPSRGGRWVNLPTAAQVYAGLRFATS